MGVFVEHALQNILRDLPRKYSELRAACRTVIDDLQNCGRHSGDRTRPAELCAPDPNKCFVALRLACTSGHLRSIEEALDCIQKLFGYGCLDGKISFAEDPSRSLVQEFVRVVADCQSCHEDSIHLQIIKALVRAVSTPACAIHGKSLLHCARVMYNIHLSCPNTAIQATAKSALTQMISHVFERMENDVKDKAFLDPSKSLNQSVSSEVTSSFALAASGALSGQNMNVSASEADFDEDDAGNREGGHQSDSLPVLQRDAWRLFRSLCQLSRRPFPRDEDADSIRVRSRILSLELLHGIVQKAGPVFRTHEKLIHFIKEDLCLSLVTNCVSHFVPVMELSFSIFQALIIGFKEHLKGEIGILFDKVVLKILESEITSFDQKRRTVEMLLRLCEDPTTILSLFINYDCELNAVNVYEKLISRLATLVQHEGLEKVVPPAPLSGAAASGRSSAVSPELSRTADGLTSQQAELQDLALRALTAALNSMLIFYREKTLEEEQERQMENLRAMNLSENEDDEDVEGEEGSGSDGPPVQHVVSFRRNRAGMADQFEKQKQLKTEWEEAIRVFKDSPKKGMRVMFEAGLVEQTPEAVAQLFLSKHRLDLTSVGDYMGELDDFCVSVMYHYVDQLDFSNLELDQALRKFLSGFKIPGEAQKIDRMMIKFAERYLHCNPGTFSCADTAYVLAFSCIMLHTDAHNPAIKDRMTKEQFIRNNRGIDDEKDIPSEVLSAIYDRITTEEFTLSGETALTRKQKQQLISGRAGHTAGGALPSQEDPVVAELSELFNKSGKDRGHQVFHQASHSSQIRPMFEVTQRIILPAMEELLERSCSLPLVDATLVGLRDAIHIACIFSMEKERGEMLGMLASLADLSAPSSTLSFRTVSCMKLMLYIGLEEGNYLEDNWVEVLMCVSQLELLQTLSAGIQAYEQSRKSRDRPRGKSGRVLPSVNPEDFDISMFQNRSGPLSRFVQTLCEGHLVMDMDRIFTKSAELTNSNAVVKFVESLCVVSRQEIESRCNSRMFSLQKLVEVAYFNMNQIRIVWTRIWHHMAEHFETVSCLGDLQIATFALDSLRQLAMKFLEKDELAQFQFQRDFLRPFQTILVKSNSVELREMVIQCVNQMIMARSRNIRSGWWQIFHILSDASHDTDERVVDQAFQTTQEIVSGYLDLVRENFLDLYRCMASFGLNTVSTEKSFGALFLCRYLCDQVLRGALEPQIPAVIPGIRNWVSVRHDTSSQIDIVPQLKGAAADFVVSPNTGDALYLGQDSHHRNLLLSCLQGFANTAAQSPVVEIRECAVKYLFEAVHAFAWAVDEHVWCIWFSNVFFSIFQGSDLSLSWQDSTGKSVFLEIIQVVKQYAERVFPVFDSVLAFFSKTLEYGNIPLSKLSVEMLLHLADEIGSQMGAPMWNQFTTSCVDILGKSRPQLLQLVPATPAAEPAVVAEGTPVAEDGDEGTSVGRECVLESVGMEEVVFSFMVQMLGCELVNGLLHKHANTLGHELTMQLLGGVHKVYRHAISLGEHHDALHQLDSKGMDEPLELLARLQRESASMYFLTLSAMYVGGCFSAAHLASSVDPFLEFSFDMFNTYVESACRASEAASSPPTFPRFLHHYVNMTPVIVEMLTLLYSLEHPQFVETCCHCGRILTDLVVSPAPEVRAALRPILARIVTQCSFGNSPPPKKE